MNDQGVPPFARARAASGALFLDDGGRVLLVRPTYKPFMDIPGGCVEPGETPYGACIREVQEELGIRPAIGRLLVVDWSPSPKVGDRVLFVFDGGTLGDALLRQIRFVDKELSAYEFHSVEELDGLLIERLARRLKAAVTARELGRIIYLEHGQALPVE
ncbi:NUDIX domain-containing protein [Nonomuraea sp. NPDC051191]|uniref:NUDIX domain-containing protein n=1 Tax=Nonomuraea sp. NPDC051191 TaxID=3364372 RepID=UPI003797A148